MESKSVFRMQRFQAIHELSPEHFFEHIHRQEKLLLRVDPVRVVRSQTAGGNNTMNVRMQTSSRTIP